MRRMTFVTTTAACCLALASQARAYVRTTPPGSQRPARWPSSEITLWVDTTRLPSSLSKSSFLAVAQASASAWSAPSVSCTAVQVVVRESPMSLTGAARDGKNSIVFQTRHWCRGGADRTGNCYDRRRAAYTTVHFGTASAHLAEAPIEEADIELNGVSFAWNGQAHGPDLAWVLTHEIGHVLGFDHVCTPQRSRSMMRDHSGQRVPPCNRQLLAATMAPAPGSHGPPLAAFGAIDIDAARSICDIYPSARSKTASPESPSSLLALLGILAGLGAWLGFRRRGRIKD